MECPVLRIEVSSTSLRMEFPMSGANTTSPLRQRMLEDMAARKLTHTRSAATFTVASGSPPGSNARPIRQHPGYVSLDQLKVMGAIERCRTAALGGHVARCRDAACGHTEIAYNSCRNRHCPKCRARRHADGWLNAKRNSCRCRTFTSCTRCQASCVTSRTRTSAWSTTF